MLFVSPALFMLLCSARRSVFPCRLLRCSSSKWLLGCVASTVSCVFVWHISRRCSGKCQTPQSAKHVGHLKSSRIGLRRTLWRIPAEERESLHLPRRRSKKCLTTTPQCVSPPVSNIWSTPPRMPPSNKLARLAHLSHASQRSADVCNLPHYGLCACPPQPPSLAKVNQTLVICSTAP